MTAHRRGCTILTSDIPTGTAGAVEIVAAADADSIELWKLINGRGEGERWLVNGLQGGWLVTLDPSARAKRLLRKELPALLSELENRCGTQSAGSTT
jgi:hypothetical protein